MRANLVTAFVLAICLAAVSACGGGEEEGEARSVPMFRGDPAHSGVNPGPGVERSPRLLWRFETGNSISSSPAVVDGVVYIGNTYGRVYALDAATGEERWRFKKGDMVQSSPAVVGSVVYIGSLGLDSYVYALDAATGEQRWRFETGGWVESSPAVVDGVVYIGSNDSYVYALDAATGEERWRFKTNDEVRSSPAVVDGVVYIGSKDSYVYAITEGPSPTAAFPSRTALPTAPIRTAMPLSQSDALWDWIAVNSPEVHPILRPTYLPSNLSRVTLEPAEQRLGCVLFGVSYMDSAGEVRLSLAGGPWWNMPLPGPDTVVEEVGVRGTTAHYSLQHAAEPLGLAFLTWDEAGRWGRPGDDWHRDYVQYLISSEGLPKEELLKVANALEPVEPARAP